MFTGPNIVTDGLILALDGSSSRSLTSGSTWNDLSGNNISGIVSGSAVYDNTDGIAGIQFPGPGVERHMTFENVPISTTTGIGNTVEQVFYMGTNNYMTFVFGDVLLDIWVASAVGFGINNGGGLIYGISPSELALLRDRWIHLVVYFPYPWGATTYTDSKMYINGEEQTISLQGGSVFSRTLTSSQTVNLGGGYNLTSTTYTANAKIALTRMYNRELTQQEVTRNFNAVKSRFGIN